MSNHSAFLAGVRRELWAGPLERPLAPGRKLERMIREGLDYPQALESLRALAAHGVAPGPALDLALMRWDWSIDIAALAVELRRPGALAGLEARVRAQGRRHGVLAWALWEAGRPEVARLLDGIDPASPSFVEDMLARAEIALRLAHWDRVEASFAALGVTGPAPLRIAPGLAVKLRLQQIWMREGAAALAASLTRSPAPDHAEVWAFLFHVWLSERDFAPARAALARLDRLRPAQGAGAIMDRARFALDCEDPDKAHAELVALPILPLWERGPREHVLRLRLALMEADRAADPPPLWVAARDTALAAARLWPGHGALAALTLSARERCEDWEALAAELVSLPPEPQRLQSLARLGQPCPGLMQGPASHDLQLERHRTDAMLWLESGKPSEALRACDRTGLPAPTDAWFREPYVEALLWERAPRAALALADLLLERNPSRMGLTLQRARARFFAGDFAGAEADLAHFRALKEAQTGTPPPEDLRDMVTRDALASRQSLPLDEPAAASAARLGEKLEAHPGLAACWLSRPGARGAFDGVPGAIPARLTLYWEGPLSAPVARGFAAWTGMVPDARLFDRASALAWLKAEDPEALRAFQAQTRPAGRADVFRASRMAKWGGIYADPDEFPRSPVLDWLNGADAVVVLESGYGTAANNFLAARPGHPLLARLRARILARRFAAEPYPWWDSGPAQLTAALAGHLLHDRPVGLRVLSQAQYCARVSTNLPFPHKHGAGHWRQGLARPGAKAALHELG